MAPGTATMRRVLCLLLSTLLVPAAAAQAAAPASASARRLHVTVTLKPRRPAALAAYARAVSTPSSPLYRHFLSPAQFRRSFAAAPAQIAAVRRSLMSRGLAPGPASAGGLSIPVTATAAQLERALSISPGELRLPGRRTAIVQSVRRAAAGAGGTIQAVIGLSPAPGPRPLLVRARPGATRGATLTLTRAARRPRTVGHSAAGAPAACPQAATAATAQSAHTADQIASAYGFSGVYAGGDEGQGVTVAVYELESDDPGDLAAYQSCYGTRATISYVPVDGGAGSGGGSGEAALDIENLIGLAPAIHVLVYQGPNSNSSAPGSGPYDTFSAIVNQDRARVVTVSWGQCEQAVGQAAAGAENTLFEQATIQGQSIIAADGDSGAQDCYVPGQPLPQNEVAVDDPSSQPYVTGVGGTTLSALGPRPAESVWNSGTGPLSGSVQPGAGGGGVSGFWQMPAAQLDAAASLGVRAASSGGPCGNTGGWCRTVPDVSADADPTSGYLIYWNGNGSAQGQPQGWQGIGGTSAAAPLWAALVALADASPGCATSPVGYADPALYRAAGSAYAADFNDVTSGNNDFTATNGGRYRAAGGYDAASGLGSPDAQALVPALCAESVSLGPPGAQNTTVHAPVWLRLRAGGAPGAVLGYTAIGLPSGVRIDRMTGVITGRPARTGHYQVRVTAHDGRGSTALQVFPWTVGGAPRVEHLSFNRRGPQLTFVVAAGAHAPALQSLALSLPAGLRLAAARRGVSVHSGSGRGVSAGFTARLAGGTLTLTLRKAEGSVRVTLGPPSLRGQAGPTPRAAGGARLVVMVTDASRGRSRVTAGL